MKTQKRDSNKEKSKKEIFSYATQLDQSLTVLILPGTTTYKSQCISKYSRESFFLLKGNSTIRFSYRDDNSEKFKRFRKDGGFDYTPSHIKVFLGNEYNGYINTARNAKLTSTRIVYEKTLMKR